LGLEPDIAIETGGPIAIAPGDVVLLLTDGFQESLSPERKIMGLERVLSIAASHREAPAMEIIHRLHDAAREFAQGAPQRDDMSAIVIKALAAAPADR
jgi:serine phosphatase RsbU (regulator of sigma subunit)